MAKKLLSILAAASMIASAAVNLTVVSAEGGINVTDCNVANGAENVNTAAIVLTFDENVTKDELAEAVKINGQSDNFTMDVKDNKAQLAINGVTKNTNYTLSVTESDNETFTRSFKTGNNVYISDWSQIGTNADRFTLASDWGGKWYDMPASERSENEAYLKMSDKNALEYSLETASGDGILEISYDRFLPSYITDENGDPTETQAQHISYGMVDKLTFDDGRQALLYTLKGTSTPRITLDEWHSYKYIIDFTKQTTTFYLDDEKQDYIEWDKVDANTTYTYVKSLRLQVGGDPWDREQWIKNIRAVRKNPAGTWGTHWSLSTDVNGVMTSTTKNTSEYQYEQVKYNLNTPITNGKVKISFEVNANEALADDSTKTGSTDIRIGAEKNGDSGMTLYHPYKKPIMDEWDNNEKAVLNLPIGVTSLAPNEWHKYEFVVDVASNDDTITRTVQYITVDGVSTICNVTDTKSAVACLIFTMPRVNNASLGDNVLKVRNVEVIDNYTAGNISVTSNVPESGKILPENLELTFSSPITKESLDSFKVYDEDGETVKGCTFKLDEKTQQTVTLEMSNYNLNAYYEVGIKATGYLGGSCESQEISFTTPSHGKITGTWTDKWWTNKDGTSMTQNADGIITFNVVNDKTDYENAQANRESFAYSFDQTVTGTDVPLTIKYSFKANEALTKSKSPVRFYGAAKTLEGFFNVSNAYSELKYDDWYSYNKANMPEGVNGVTPDEWHTVEYAININSTTGSTLKYMVYDDVITYTSTTDGAPMLNKNLKGIQNIDFWFYSTSATEGNYELQIKDLSVVKGASSFDITATNNSLTSSNNKIHLEFVNPVNETALNTVKVMSGTSVIDGAVTCYELAANGMSADITIGDLATGNYTISFAGITDVYGKTSETQSFDFAYTAAKTEGIVEIKAASVSEATADGVTNVNVSVKLSNGKFSAVSGKLIAAAYDSENKLVGIGFEDASNLEAENTDISKTVTFKKPSESYTSVRVMLWNSLEKMEAVCPSADAVLSNN